MARVPLVVIVILAVWCTPAPAATTVARSGDLVLRAREKGGRLCITLLRKGRHYQGRQCGRVPRSPHRPLTVLPDVGFDNYAAAVAPSVRMAETESRNGPRERHRTFAARGFSARFVLIPAPPSAVFVRWYGAGGALLGMDAAYTGRWAGKVRFFAAAVDPGREVTGAVVRNADGAVIGVSERGIVRRRVHRRTLAERDGRGVQLVRRTGDPPCLTAFAPDLPPAPRFCTDLDPGTPIDGPVYLYSGAVIVPCSPRLAIAYGRMPDDRPTPRVLLDGGDSVRARRLKLRGEDGWVAFLPGAGVRGLRGAGSLAPLRLPAAAEQCGYNAARAF